AKHCGVPLVASELAGSALFVVASSQRENGAPREGARGHNTGLIKTGVISMLKALFLNPPSFEGFDGGAGSRYQAKREIRSFWYPTWLAQPAALVPGSRLVDAPARGLSLDDVLPMAKDYELAVLHTSTPSFPNDVQVAEALKDANPKLLLGFV